METLCSSLSNIESTLLQSLPNADGLLLRPRNDILRSAREAKTKYRIRLHQLGHKSYASLPSVPKRRKHIEMCDTITKLRRKRTSEITNSYYNK